MKAYRLTWLMLSGALASAGVVAASMSAPLALCILFGGAAGVAIVGGWWLARPGSAHRLSALTRAFSHVGTPYALVPTYLDVRLFTEEQLCEAWRARKPTLLDGASVRETIRAVEERQACLDELLRRHPAGITAWLASEPGAKDPLTYLADPVGDHPPINWDELIPRQDS